MTSDEILEQSVKSVRGKLKPIKVCSPTDDKWLTCRRSGISASEAAAAIGLSRYTTPHGLYHKKRGNLPDEAPTEAMLRGQIMEPLLRTRFVDIVKDSKMTVGRDTYLYRDPQHEYMLATPDFPIYRGNKLVAALECKSHENFAKISSEYGQEGTDEVPADTLVQCQQQIQVLGIDTVYVCVAFNLTKFKVYVVNRHDDLIDSMIDAERELWMRIQDGEEPTADYEHKSTLDVLTKLYPVVPDKKVELSDYAMECWEEYEGLGRRASEIKHERDTLKAIVLDEMKDAGIGTFPGGEREIIRAEVPAKQISYERKPYTRTSARKIKT